MNLTMLPFEDKDFEIAAVIAKHGGRPDQNCAYTSTSSIIGIEWFARWDGDTNKFCVIKTEELGFLAIRDLDDMGIREKIKGKFPNSIWQAGLVE